MEERLGGACYLLMGMRCRMRSGLRGLPLHRMRHPRLCQSSIGVIHRVARLAVARLLRLVRMAPPRLPPLRLCPVRLNSLLRPRAHLRRVSIRDRCLACARGENRLGQPPSTRYLLVLLCLEAVRESSQSRFQHSGLQ